MRIFVEGSGNCQVAIKAILRVARDNLLNGFVGRSMFFPSLNEEFAFRKLLIDGGIQFDSFELTNRLNLHELATFSELGDLVDSFLASLAGEPTKPQLIVTNAQMIMALSCWPKTRTFVKPGTVCVVTGANQAIQIISPED